MSRMGLGALVAAAVAMAGCSKLQSLGIQPQINSRTLGQGAEFVKQQKECDALAEQAVPFDEEQTIGQTVALKVIGNRGLVQDEAATRYLNVVGQNLAGYSDRPGLPWLFGIINDDATVNAFATPGGYVFVTSGLLKKVENEAQLAGVLAHEITHIEKQHAVNQYKRFKANVCRAEVTKNQGAEAVGPIHVNNPLTGNVNLADAANLKFLDQLTTLVADWLTKEGPAAAQEKESDTAGLRLAALAGYQPGEYIRFIEALGSAGQSKKYASSSARAQYMTAAVAALEKNDDPLKELGTLGPDSGLVAPPLHSSVRAVSQR